MKIEDIYRKYSDVADQISSIIKHDVGPQHYTYSFSTLELCPFSFKREKIDRDVDQTITRFGTNVGSYMHDLAEFDVRMRTRFDQKDWLGCEEMVDKLCQQEPEASDFIEELTESLQLFRINFDINKKFYTASEMEIGVNLNMEDTGFNHDKTWFRGIIDYLEVDGNCARIVDYKNYPKIHSFSQINNHHEEVGRQQMGYASLISAMFPRISEVVYEIYYFRYGTSRMSSEKDEFGNIQKRFISKDQIKDWWEYNQRLMVLRDSRKTFPPIPSQKKCQYCSVVNECPWQQNERTDADVIITGEDEAKDALRELRVVEEKRKRLKSALKTYAKEIGPVEAGTESFGYYETKREKVDPRVVVKACQDADEDIARYINVSKRNLKKLKGKLSKEQIKTIDEATEIITKTRLSS